MEVEILDSTPSHYVIRTEGRNFPALVIQGDTFHSWISDLKGVFDMAVAQGNEGLAEELSYIIKNPEERLGHYEDVLKQHGFGKPY